MYTHCVCGAPLPNFGDLCTECREVVMELTRDLLDIEDFEVIVKDTDEAAELFNLDIDTMAI